MKRFLALPLLVLSLWAAPDRQQSKPRTFVAAQALDQAIRSAIAEQQITGAVLLVSRDGKILYHKAYGFRTVSPRRELMTPDTIFDVASLTKVVATTPAIMKLFEEGKIRLNDKVTRYLPEFQGGSSDITVRDLLTHFSGLSPDLILDPPWSGYETGIQKALVEPPAAGVGERFIYSDINFILLGEIVRRLSGKPLQAYCRQVVFSPLGMRDTMFLPPARFRSRIAPTERLPGEKAPLRGVVHDTTARYMGGVAGHAGLFSTATDLARFAEMMIGLGRRGSVRLFSPLTVRKFTTPQSPPDQPILRGLGWDIDSPYSANRGELFPIGSYGHTGFTGTSLWIDPVTKTSVILLANSVHPNVRQPITSLRSRVATIVAAALRIDAPGVALTGYNETLTGAGIRRVVARNADVLTGLDVMAASGFAELKGRRVGLITNRTGISRTGRRNVDLMLEAGIDVAALFSPEHGIGADQERNAINHSRDPATGIPIWSLYGTDGPRPTAQMLKNTDALVFDIQDVGVRFYTYISTMTYAMEQAARHKLPFFVLDRPNPLTGVYVQGPMLDNDLVSFVGCFPLPLRHGMTVGELAQMINTEKKLGADLRVTPMKNWHRGDWFDCTGLPWLNPSPNIRSLTAALLYPAVAVLEFSKNYSVGRGTEAPFEQIGADWIDGRQLAAFLNRRFIPGVRFYPTEFKPTTANFAGRAISGVRILLTNREKYDCGRLALEIASALQRLYPGRISFEDNLRLIGSRETISALSAGEEPRDIQYRNLENLRAFLRVREKYLLYR